MIVWTSGEIFDNHYDMLVCPVNCVGRKLGHESPVGRDLALQFSDRVPGLASVYLQAKVDGELKPGRLKSTTWTREDDEGEYYVDVVLFAVKNDWRKPTQLKWVDQGLMALAESLKASDVQSVAIPAIGSGKGGLRWGDVRYLIEKYLGHLDLEVTVFEPSQNGPARRRGRPGRSGGPRRHPKAFKGHSGRSGAPAAPVAPPFGPNGTGKS